MKENKQKLFWIWTLFGLLLMGIFVAATTIVTDTGITVGGIDVATVNDVSSLTYINVSNATEFAASTTATRALTLDIPAGKKVVYFTVKSKIRTTEPYGAEGVAGYYQVRINDSYYLSAVDEGYELTTTSGYVKQCSTGSNPSGTTCNYYITPNYYSNSISNISIFAYSGAAAHPAYVSNLSITAVLS